MKIIGELMKKTEVTELIAATDAGREGELIFRLVYEKLSCKKPIKRLWISSMEESAIAEGFLNLSDGADYELLYQSALFAEPKRTGLLELMQHACFLFYMGRP